MKRLAITAILMASVIGAHEAGATPINITANRLVQVGSDITGDLLGPNSPSTALGSFGDSVDLVNFPDALTFADQDSVVGASSFSGVGFSDTENLSLVFNKVSAFSLFEVFFELTGNHNYSLGGFLTADSGGSGEFGDSFGEARFDLSGPGGFSFRVCCFIDSVELSQTGTLGPGSYHLTVLSFSEAGAAGPFDELFGFGTYDFTFDLRSVPEPGSLALLVIGLALAAFRRSTTRSTSFGGMARTYGMSRSCSEKNT